ncbi:hypothetical protein GPJ56_007840 [Histomonas meleagridis]|uniref:uncharacterized protein n=1 Tax=Histomonas meleagridis TaxID=135588 RepID=UPI003559C064|nr:hypothetical protein GPJ56_007840 [Histomonas meleagridis]KAH0804061.1 hypothetical protein GO595_002891 [Histomonas meleagridis]
MENRKIWEQEIPNNQTVFLDYDDDMVLTVTSAKLSKINDSQLEQPAILTAKIKSAILGPSDGDATPEDNDESHFSCKEIEICSLIPKTNEQITTEITFSPMDIVELTNSSDHDILLSGFMVPNNNKFFESEEEEEESEELKSKRQKEMDDLINDLSGDETTIKTEQTPFELLVLPNTTASLSFEGKEDKVAFLMYAKILDKTIQKNVTLYVITKDGSAENSKKIPIACFSPKNLKGKELDFIVQKDSGVALFVDGPCGVKVSGVFDDADFHDSDDSDDSDE